MKQFILFILGILLLSCDSQKKTEIVYSKDYNTSFSAFLKNVSEDKELANFTGIIEFSPEKYMSLSVLELDTRKPILLGSIQLNIPNSEHAIFLPINHNGKKGVNFTRKPFSDITVYAGTECTDLTQIKLAYEKITIAQGATLIKLFPFNYQFIAYKFKDDYYFTSLNQLEYCNEPTLVQKGDMLSMDKFQSVLNSLYNFSKK